MKQLINNDRMNRIPTEPETSLVRGTILEGDIIDETGKPTGDKSKTYKIDCLLSEEGGFCLLYSGNSEGLNGTVAIKELFPREASRDNNGSVTNVTDEHFTLFHNEYAILKRLTKSLSTVNESLAKSIAKPIEMFKSNNTLYIVMEYIEGKNLTQLKEEGKLSASKTAGLLNPIVDLLNYMHSIGVYHCDITPSNILLRDDKDDKPTVLIDFGSVQEYGCQGNITIRNIRIRTPNYIDPDRNSINPNDDEELALNIDFYGLVAVAFYLMTSQDPDTEKGEIKEQLKAHNVEDPAKSFFLKYLGKKHERIKLKTEWVSIFQEGLGYDSNKLSRNSETPDQLSKSSGYVDNYNDIKEKESPSAGSTGSVNTLPIQDGTSQGHRGESKPYAPKRSENVKDQSTTQGNLELHVKNWYLVAIFSVIVVALIYYAYTGKLQEGTGLDLTNSKEIITSQPNESTLESTVNEAEELMNRFLDYRRGLYTKDEMEMQFSRDAYFLISRGKVLEGNKEHPLSKVGLLLEDNPDYRIGTEYVIDDVLRSESNGLILRIILKKK